MVCYRTTSSSAMMVKIVMTKVLCQLNQLCKICNPIATKKRLQSHFSLKLADTYYYIVHNYNVKNPCTKCTNNTSATRSFRDILSILITAR